MGMLFLGVFILPVFYIHWAQKNKGKIFLKHFTSTAAKNQVNVSDSDMWNTRCIGIDKISGKLFALKKDNDQEETMLIDLKEIDNCIVSPTYRNIKGGGKTNKILERIDLTFTNKNSNVPGKSVNFYDSNENSPLGEEQVLAEKWASIINNYLQNK